MCSDTASYTPLQLQGRQRKLSFPASIHSNLLQSRTLQDINCNNNLAPYLWSRRRFSNVGDVVSRKLSTTIGWRHAQVIGNFSQYLMVRVNVYNKYL